MKHFLTLSLLFSTLACASAHAVQPFYINEYGEVQKYADGTNVELVRVIGDPLFILCIGTIDVEVYAVEADQSVIRGLIAVNEDTKGLTAGSIIGTVGGETYRVAAIELTEDSAHFNVVLEVACPDCVALEANEHRD